MASSSARPLQLDQWANTEAPLTSSQRASVNRLAEWLHRNSSDFKQQQQQHFQEKLQPNDTHTTPSNTAPDQQDGVNGTAESTESAAAGLPTLPSNDPITLPDAHAPLVSAQSFLAWYTQLSDSVTSSTQSSHLQALKRISDTTSTADNLLAQLEACQVNVSELRAGTAFVQDSSRGIREQAQALLDSQTHLDILAQQIASRLSFFTLLPYATTMLSSPDSSIVYSQSFLQLMHQLEMVLLFLQQEPARSYRDAALYTMRYSQCVTRAATLAKMAVVRDIKSQAEHIADRVKQLDASQTASAPAVNVKGKARDLTDDSTQPSAIPKHTADALFGDASHQVTKLRPLIFELQKRANTTAASTTPSASTAAEFESLLQECRTAWFQYRRPLLSRILLQRITEIETQIAAAPPSNDPMQLSIVLLARAGIHLLSYMLRNEYEVYQQMFGGPTGDDDATEKQDRELDAGLGSYLAELAETVMRRLRPKLAKEQDLVVLAETCSTIADAVHSKSGQSAWSKSLLPVLRETQTRLVSRAQSLVSSDIAHFQPNENDGELDFPERIKAYKSRTGKAPVHRRGKSGAGLLDAALSASHAASSSKVQQEKVQLFTLPVEQSSTYYATVGMVLELLYYCQARVPVGAFGRIATAAVEACLASVAKGAQALVARKNGERLDREDGWLFEVRQLEILREAVVSVELVLKQAHDQTTQTGVAKDASGGAGTASLVDLSSLVNAINSLWTNTGRLLYPSFAAGAAAADANADSVSVDMNASRTAVASRLDTLIESLAKAWSDAIVLPLRVYVDRTAADDDTGAKFKTTYQAFQTCVDSIIADKAGKVALWVEDKEVGKMLMHKVADKVGEMFARFQKGKPENVEVESAEQVRERVLAIWSTKLGL